MSTIREAALAIYTPPFRYEHGYVWDSNNEMVSDGQGMRGLLAARIRGWGRIQYMDDPAGRAAALQDEIGHMVAEALNAFWTANMKANQ